MHFGFKKLETRSSLTGICNVVQFPVLSFSLHSGLSSSLCLEIRSLLFAFAMLRWTFALYQMRFRIGSSMLWPTPCNFFFSTCTKRGSTTFLSNFCRVFCGAFLKESGYLINVCACFGIIQLRIACIWCVFKVMFVLRMCAVAGCDSCMWIMFYKLHFRDSVYLCYMC